MRRNRVLLSSLVTVFFCTIFLSEGLDPETRKHCCQVGTNYSSNGFDCKTFLPEMVGTAELAGAKPCLTMVDVCCKIRNREILCEEGIKDAKKSYCSAEDGERKECCDACLTGTDAGNNKETCSGLGLGEPYDGIYIKCCKEAFVSTPSTTTLRTSTLKPTTPTPINNFELPLGPIENICDSDVCAQICEPTATSFRCDCFRGYTLMEDGVSCRPQKRSLKKGGRCENNNPCDQDCTDTGTEIKCSCREGYKLSHNNRTCSDIDECELNLHDCLTKDDCINEIGTYSCYEPDFSDINDNFDFEKKCPPAYKFNFEKQVCDDIDECLIELMCVPPKTCKNTVGSFICEGEDVPNCPPGFHFKPATQACADIDECLNGENDCNKESQECLNTKGNYTCVDKASRNTCPPGFKKNFQTQLCEDIDECMENPDLCDYGQTCVNEPGGHSCVENVGPNRPSAVVPPKTQFRTTSTITPRTTTTPTTIRTTTTPTTTRTTTTPTTTRTTPSTTRTTLSTTRTTLSTTRSTTSTIRTTPSTRRTIPTTTTPRTTTSTTTARPTCPQGYNYVSETHTCVDINECQMGAHKCQPLERCDNTIGSYHCSRIYGCGTGYTLNSENGLCEDDNECLLGVHNCKQLGDNYECRNTLGSYRCQQVKQKKPLYPHPTVTSSTTPVSTKPPPSYPSSDIPVHNKPYNVHNSPPFYPTKWFTYLTTGYTNTTTTKSPIVSHPTIYFKPYPSSPDILPYSPRIPTRNQPSRIFPSLPTREYPIITGQLKKCLPGYVMNRRGECEDIDECENNPCGRHEKCINYNGRFECASPMQCKIGFELDEPGEQCIDVNECSQGTHKCNPTQICKNYQGYYTCDCPLGHHFNKKTEVCEDMDECKIFRPCGYADCINTVGSYRCECKKGFRRNNNICEDVNECNEQSELCEQKCINTWGSFRCSCKAGFTLNNDNRTCADMDECERFKDRTLCIGTCKNIPGSYTCECPSGYKLGNDGRVCVDIDECQQNICHDDDVCLNTRGGYKCYRIKCPSNYVKDTEHKSRCKRLQSLCDPRDYKCLLLPEQYTYHYITLVSNYPMSHGHIQLFQIKGPQWPLATAEFSLKLVDVSCPYGIKKVDDGYFQKVTDEINTMALYLIRPIQGPQEIKIEIQMRLFRNNIVIGNAIVYITIAVSEHPF